MNYSKIALIISMGVISATTLAQNCKENIVSSYSQGQFLDNQDGTITDVVNGLLWKKCTEGQSYNQVTNECVGSPVNVDTWQDALELSSEAEDDYRLPNIKELGTLVQRRCIDPAIDLDAFPSTPSAVYWSNTADMANIHEREGVEGKLIDFNLGTEFLSDVSDFRFIRLVKTI